MGRYRSRHHDLPARMHRKGGAYYYVQSSRPRRWISLGSDRVKALISYAQLEQTALDGSLITFGVIAERYRKEVIPLKAYGTQKEYSRAIDALRDVFDSMPLEAIGPEHVRKYLDSRTKKVTANREIAVLSTIFNRAREWGYTKIANPCQGVHRNRELGRDRYVTDEEYRLLYAHADPILQDAMDLAYYTGQRVGDVLRMKRADIQDGALSVRQAKTKARLRIAIEGELAAVLDRITARAVVGVYLLTTERGDRLSHRQLRWRFDRARDAAKVDFQFRDLRAKAATDMENLEQAQKLLGHATRDMTEHYTKKRAGEKVRPVRRKL